MTKTTHQNNTCDITYLNVTLINVWFMCAVVSSMSSLTAWTEKSFNPVGWTDEVWDTGLYHPSQPLLYGKRIYIWAVPFVIRGPYGSTAFRYTPMCDEQETGTYHRQVANLSFSLFLSITFRLIPPQLSLMVLLFMNMKDNIQLTASLSSYRYYYITITHWPSARTWT